MLLLIYTLPSIVAARYERGVWHAAGAAPLRPRGVDLLLYALIRAPPRRQSPAGRAVTPGVWHARAIGLCRICHRRSNLGSFFQLGARHISTVAR